MNSTVRQTLTYYCCIYSKTKVIRDERDYIAFQVSESDGARNEISGS